MAATKSLVRIQGRRVSQSLQRFEIMTLVSGTEVDLPGVETASEESVWLSAPCTSSEAVYRRRTGHFQSSPPGDAVCQRSRPLLVAGPALEFSRDCSWARWPLTSKKLAAKMSQLPVRLDMISFSIAGLMATPRSSKIE
ncbi:unnamed protein product [Diplocarpon coronariae]|uniref:Uncharacterized protein n=1 Tax=Diplocarpon coronariae TaxID=2795749 RepID=A0A218YZ24_9HELO|nr:hypothetical protein B2J93_6525 [Marssonina coronariae]